MFGNGAVGAPSIAFANSTTTGFYRIGADNIGLATAGVLRLSVTATGNVSATAPSASGHTFTGRSGVTTFINNTVFGVTVEGSTSTTDYSVIDFPSSAGNTNRAARIGVIAAGGGSSMVFGTSNSYATGITNSALTIAPAGTVTIATPASGTALTLPSVATTTSFACANAFLGIGTAFAAGQSELFTTGTNPLGIGSTGAATLTLYTAAATRLAISSAGQTTIFEPLNAINALKNAATYEIGSFTGTYTGGTTSPTTTVNWSRCGNVITMELGGLASFVSNAITFTMTGLPAALAPNRQQISAQGYQNTNNSVPAADGSVFIAAAGVVLQFARASSSSAWTAAGNKGWNGGAVFSYNLT